MSLYYSVCVCVCVCVPELAAFKVLQKDAEVGCQYPELRLLVDVVSVHQVVPLLGGGGEDGGALGTRADGGLRGGGVA